MCNEKWNVWQPHPWNFKFFGLFSVEWGSDVVSKVIINFIWDTNFQQTGKQFSLQPQFGVKCVWYAKFGHFKRITHTSRNGLSLSSDNKVFLVTGRQFSSSPSFPNVSEKVRLRRSSPILWSEREWRYR